MRRYSNELFLASSQATIESGESLGRQLAADLDSGELALPLLITLSGDLGAGKTTFCQGLCLGLGIDEPDEVISPTFTLANEYGGAPPVFHLDLYRLADENQFYEAGLDEYLSRSGITLIEWPERMTSWDSRRLDVTLKFSKTGRFLSITSGL